MTEGKHILIVDDDPRVRDMLARYLDSEGFRVTQAADGMAMRACMVSNLVDLVILDVMMPKEDGFTLTREIRANSAIPIILITGKGEVVDRVVGLEIGADDYIAKPFHLREVLARIRTVLRRSGPERTVGNAAANKPAGQLLRFAGWQLDLAGMALTDPQGAPVPLTSGEFNLLTALAKAPNRPLNRDQIMDLVHGRAWSPYDRSIDTQVGRLRKKIEPDPGNPTIIKTVRGVGYLFAAKVEST